MLIQEDIGKTIRTAKLFAGDQMLPKILELEANGNNVDNLYKKYFVFLKWIEILEEYYDYNFDENGVIEEPLVTCLTVNQASSVLAKLKLVIGNKKYPTTDWILEFGIWNDDGKWIDSQVWNDSQTWT